MWQNIENFNNRKSLRSPKKKNEKKKKKKKKTPNLFFSPFYSFKGLQNGEELRY